MARWAPAKADVIGEIADEILHNYRRGRAIVGVDGLPGAHQAEFADALAESLRERGADAYRAGTAHGPQSARELAIEPFRRSEGDYAPEGDAVLVLDGTRLHDPALLSVFAYTLWLVASGSDGADTDSAQSDYERHAAPRVRATANVDNSDPEHPRRTFADSC
jgi:uridine kinase